MKPLFVIIILTILGVFGVTQANANVTKAVKPQKHQCKFAIYEDESMLANSNIAIVSQIIEGNENFGIEYGLKSCEAQARSHFQSLLDDTQNYRAAFRTVRFEFRAGNKVVQKSLGIQSSIFGAITVSNN